MLLAQTLVLDMVLPVQMLLAQTLVLDMDMVLRKAQIRKTIHEKLNLILILIF
jgi:hypothetical protein